MKKQHLTEKEEEIMRVFWANGPMYVREVMEKLPTPLHFNTVSTFVRSLESKGLLAHESFSGSYRYHAVVTEAEYQKSALGSFVERYFNNSYRSVVSALVNEGKLTEDEIADLVRQVRNQSKE